MKKKIVFSALTLLFLLSALSGFANGNAAGGTGCLIISAILAFFAYRSLRRVPDGKTAPASQSGASAHDASPVSTANDAPIISPINNVPDMPVSSPASVANDTPPQDEYEFVPIKVAGVTFKNEKGPSRQTILRKLKFHDAPFEEYADVGIRQYEYDGKPAYGVYANDMQIGNIPAEQVQFVYDNFERLEAISHIDVYGGGRGSDGRALSYGCKITLKFRR